LKVSWAQAESNRNRIIDVAGVLFRDHGFDGVAIADLMKAASLTHGGFYANFKSKDDLGTQASERALAAARERLETIGGAGAAVDSPTSSATMFHPNIATIRRTGACLQPWALKRPGNGGAIQSVFTVGLRSYLAALSRLLPGRSAVMKQRRAMSALSEMVGAAGGIQEPVARLYGNVWQSGPA
jgi:TetR/AcrR family transcriptional repressor of nem operon